MTRRKIPKSKNNNQTQVDLANMVKIIQAAKKADKEDWQTTNELRKYCAFHGYGETKTRFLIRQSWLLK